MLRYQNWLYFWRKWREHNIARARAKAEHKAKIKALKEQLKATRRVVMSP